MGPKRAPNGPFSATKSLLFSCPYQQSEIYEISVFLTVFGVKFSASDTQTLENVARKTFHAKISRQIPRLLWQRKTKKNFTPHFCRVAALRIFCGMNSVRCIVKGEARKNPLCWRFSGGFDFLRSACFVGIPQENRSTDFYKHPCKSICLYNAPSLHTVECFPNGV